mmetsp:Transcript_25777/g.29927  ORF Transcript_25777/g.29927 Transcript_25777/m.29927 type:complete len:83 (-) Transcript_25777:301-549(-)
MINHEIVTARVYGLNGPKIVLKPAQPTCIMSSDDNTLMHSWMKQQLLVIDPATIALKKRDLSFIFFRCYIFFIVDCCGCGYF